MHSLADDPSVVQRILDHIDNRTTDRGAGCWREPVENYRSESRFERNSRSVRRTRCRSVRRPHCRRPVPTWRAAPPACR